MYKITFVFLFLITISYSKAQELPFEGESLALLISQGIDQNDDGKIQVYEAFFTTDLDISYSYFDTDMLVYFPNLIRLNITGFISNSYSLELSHLTELEELIANDIENLSIKLPKINSQLENIKLTGNNLSFINLSGCDNLRDLDISGSRNFLALCMSPEMEQRINLIKENLVDGYEIVSSCCDFEGSFDARDANCPNDYTGELYIFDSYSSSFRYAVDNEEFNSNKKKIGLKQGKHDLIIKKGFCTDTIPFLIKSEKLDEFSLGNDTTLCESASLKLSVPNGFSLISWNTGSEEDMISVDSGVYIMNILNNNGCKISDTIEVFRTECVDIFDKNEPLECTPKIINTIKYISGIDTEAPYDLNINQAGEGVISAITRSPSVNIGGEVVTTEGRADAVYSKFDKDGRLVWKEVIESSSPNAPGAIAINERGESFFVFSSSKWIRYEIGGQSFTGTRRLTMIKLDSTGNYMWHRTLSPGLTAPPSKLITTSDGSIFLTATNSFSQPIIFNNDTIPSGDAYILRLNKDGFIQNAVAIDHAAVEFPEIAVDEDNNVYFTAVVSGDSLSVAPNEKRKINSDWQQVIVKYDSTLQYIWDDVLNVSGDFSHVKIAVDDNNGVYATGYYYSDTFYETRLIKSLKTHEIDKSSYILKKDARYGRTQWIKSVTNKSSVTPLGLDTYNGIVYARFSVNDNEIFVDDVRYSATGEFTLAFSEDGTNLYGTNLYGKIATNTNAFWSTRSFKDRPDDFVSATNSLDVSIQKFTLPHLRTDSVIYIEPCHENEIKLFGGNGKDHYSWSNGENKATSFIKANQTLELKTLNPSGCWSRTITVTNNVLEIPQFSIPETIKLEEGVTAEINAGNEGSKYSWSTGDTVKYIEVKYDDLEKDTNYVWVEVTTKDGCSAIESVQIIKELVTSLSISKDESLRIYPNPFTEQLVLSSPTHKEVIYQVYNQLGSFIEEGTFHDDRTVGEEWNSGYYFITLQSKDISHHIQVIKN